MGFVLALYQAFLEDLQCENLLGLQLAHQEHFSVQPFSQHRQQVEVVDGVFFYHSILLITAARLFPTIHNTPIYDIRNSAQLVVLVVLGNNGVKVQ